MALQMVEEAPHSVARSSFFKKPTKETRLLIYLIEFFGSSGCFGTSSRARPLSLPQAIGKQLVRPPQVDCAPTLQVDFAPTM